MTKDTSEPAFPVLGYTRIASGDLVPVPTIQPGMTLRQWYAGMALQSLIVCHAPQICASRTQDAYLSSWAGIEPEFDKWLASRSNEIADAMLAASEQEQKP